MHNNINLRERGSAVFFTMILVLAMMVLVMGAIKLVGTQYEIYDMEKKSNDTYYLAYSAAEKANDHITKYIEANKIDILKTVELRIRQELFKGNKAVYKIMDYEEDKIKIEDKLYEYYLRLVTFEKVNQYLNSKTKDAIFKEEIYTAKSDNMTSNTQVTIENILPTVVKTEENDVACTSVGHSDRKCICYWYNLKNLARASALTTEQQRLYNQLMNQDLFVINTQALIKDGKNEVTVIKKVQAYINLKETQKPKQVEVLERYEWENNPPEVLNSAVLCFSDFVVQEGANVNIRGDLVVKGSNKRRTEVAAPDENGGVIVANGGTLTVERPKSEESNSKNTGSLYTMNNVGVTNGWEENSRDTQTKAYKDKLKRSTTINVAGDIVANTVAVMDDFFLAAEDKAGANGTPYNKDMQVMNAKIEATGNVFVDNDVLIERYVQGNQIAEPYIKVEGAIFGISDGNMAKDMTIGEGFDPNKSSGVFNLSQPNANGNISQIEADSMYVNGHPYVSFDSMKSFHRLHESIGGPMDNVYSYEAVGEETLYPYKSDKSSGGSKGYLTDSMYRNMINTNKIKILNPEKMYAPGAIAANGKLYMEIGTADDDKPKLPCFVDSSHVFYRSIPDHFEFKELTGAGPLKEVYTEIMKKPEEYYKGMFGARSNLHHSKIYYDGAIGAKEHYQGIQGFMTAARGVFYDKVFAGKDREPILYNFDEFGKNGVGLTSGKLRKQICKNTSTWSYNHPIDIRSVSNEDEIDISKYYDGDAPVPTIVIVDGVDQGNEGIEIETSDTKKNEFIEIEASDTKKNQFKGIIISKKNLRIQGNLTIEGSVIVGGTQGDDKAIPRPTIIRGDRAGILVTGKDTAVTFIHNPDVLLEVQCGDKKVVRDILDMLKITGYSEPLSDRTTKRERTSKSGSVALRTSKMSTGLRATDNMMEDVFKNVQYKEDQIMINNKSILDIKGSSLVGCITTIKKVDEWEEVGK